MRCGERAGPQALSCGDEWPLRDPGGRRPKVELANSFPTSTPGLCDTLQLLPAHQSPQSSAVTRERSRRVSREPTSPSDRSKHKESKTLIRQVKTQTQRGQNINYKSNGSTKNVILFKGRITYRGISADQPVHENAFAPSPVSVQPLYSKPVNILGKCCLHASRYIIASLNLKLSLNLLVN